MAPNTNPNLVVVPYKAPYDLILLKKWFFPDQKNTNNAKTKELKNKAVAKIRVYLTRGPIPHALEMTALIIEAILMDEKITEVDVLSITTKFSKSYNQNDFSIRLTYSSIITKFVNGFLDPLQQGTYAISLHNLANNIKLPSHFVEMRHVCTHEALPSLQMLRLTVVRALEWLRSNYWDPIADTYVKLGIDNIDKIEISKTTHGKEHGTDKEPQRSVNNAVLNKACFKQAENYLKAIRKIRKSTLVSPRADFAKQFDEQLELLLQLIPSKIKPEVFAEIFVLKNYLMPHGDKCENISEKQNLGLKLLWGPFIQSLPNELLFSLLSLLMTFANSKLIITDLSDEQIDKALVTNLNTNSVLYPRSSKEISLASDWIIWILENTELVGSCGHEIITLIKKMGPCGISIRCLNQLEDSQESNSTLKETSKKLKSTWTRFWIPDSTTVQTKSFEDTVNHDNQRAKRKANESSSSHDSKKFKAAAAATVLFEPIADYKPTAFGCIP